MSEEKTKHKSTLFLERNEIWFKTVLSLMATVAALLVSIASYNTAKYQARLSASVAERENQEKQPFFSIQNIYDEEREQYIYSIVNTGGQIRDISIDISPFFFMSQEDKSFDLYIPMKNNNEDAQKHINVAFIYLPEFYVYEPADSSDILFSFSDCWLEVPSSCLQTEDGEILEVYETEKQLASNYFAHVTSSNNIDELDTIMSSKIVYYVEIFYTNYENDLEKQTFWLSRAADSTGKSSGNVILYKNESIQKDYETALKTGNVQKIDSLNDPVDTVVNQCRDLIFSCLKAFGQVNPKSQ